MPVENGQDKVVIVEGVRSPYVKAGTVFNDLPAQELGRIVVRELLAKTDLDPETVDEVIIGNIGQPPDAVNIARIIALNAGLPRKTPAVTVQRNCASGIESIIEGYRRIVLGEADIIVAGGVESMSNLPLLFTKRFQNIFGRMFRARSFGEKVGALTDIRPADLKPIVALQVGLTDPVCGLNMGETAEVLAKEFKISRERQDEFALRSHQRATKATENGRFGEEMTPVYLPPDYSKVVNEDNGIRKSQSMEALKKLRPAFDRKNGTVTAGNASQITDGAAAVLVMSEKKAKALGYEPLGSIRAYGFGALDPARMGLGPVFATAAALKKAQMTMEDIQLIELNEAFAAQVIACEEAFKSNAFAKKEMGMDHAVGEINRDILNVNGGAIALGHPVGSSATRLTHTLLLEMKHRDLNIGLATLCAEGGQGAALIVER